MPWFTYRHHWKRWAHGKRIILDLTPWREIKCSTRVFVSASEFEADIRDSACNFIGDARYTVHNVAPYDGGIKVWLEINYDDDLPIRTDYLVFNP